MTDESHQATHISAAGRLFDIVRDAASRSGATGFLAVFAAVGGAPESDHARGLEVLARVFGLVAEAKEEVLRRPELKQMLYMGAINSVDTVLRTANFSSEWKVVAPQLQQALIALEFCADQLNRLSEEEVLGEGELKELLREVEELQASMLDADIDLELRRVIVRKLEEIRGAILNYRLDGADGLRKAADSAVGGLVLKTASVTKDGRTKQVSAFLDLVVKLETVACKVWKYAALAAPAVRALLNRGNDT